MKETYDRIITINEMCDLVDNVPKMLWDGVKKGLFYSSYVTRGERLAGPNQFTITGLKQSVPSSKRLVALGYCRWLALYKKRAKFALDSTSPYIQLTTALLPK